MDPEIPALTWGHVFLSLLVKHTACNQAHSLAPTLLHSHHQTPENVVFKSVTLGDMKLRIRVLGPALRWRWRKMAAMQMGV